MQKIGINRPFWIFLALIQLVRELVICNTNNKFGENTWKTFQVIAPTRSSYWCKMKKIAINRPFCFFSAVIELVLQLLICNTHYKFKQDKWNVTKSNYWRKMQKIAINRPFWNLFPPLLNLSENLWFVTCITNLGKIHGKLFKLSCPQVNSNADADDDDDELQLQSPTFFK